LLGDGTALLPLWEYAMQRSRLYRSECSDSEWTITLSPPAPDEVWMRGILNVSETTLSKHWCRGVDVHKLVGETRRNRERDDSMDELILLHQDTDYHQASQQNLTKTFTLQASIELQSCRNDFSLKSQLHFHSPRTKQGNDHEHIPGQFVHVPSRIIHHPST
jgi:hypothetical protein